MIRVITIDDHPVVRRGLKQIIAAEQDMRVVGEAENAREAIRVIREIACDAVVLDITLPDASGLDVLSRLKSEHPTLPVLIMSIHDEEQYAVRVLKAGAQSRRFRLPDERQPSRGTDQGDPEDHLRRQIHQPLSRGKAGVGVCFPGKIAP